jgi:hypothetical protein
MRSGFAIGRDANGPTGPAVTVRRIAACMYEQALAQAAGLLYLQRTRTDFNERAALPQAEAAT